MTDLQRLAVLFAFVITGSAIGFYGAVQMLDRGRPWRGWLILACGGLCGPLGIWLASR